MIHGAFRAMGTTVDAYCAGRRGFDATVALFEEVESVCSRFREDSELSAVNRDPAAVVTVGQLLADVLDAASQAFARTGGLVDVAVGARVADWGYDRTFELVGELASPPADRDIGRWEIAGRRLRRDPGVVLDLGGIAKGWACDRAVERGFAVMVDAGGDIRSADRRTEAEVLDADDRVVTTMTLGIGALATSSVGRRTWKAGGGRAHHIIDPRSGAPAVTPVVSASVLADDAVSAETATKAALILGEESLSWLDRLEWIRGGLVVWQDGAAYATTSWVAAA